MDPARAALHDCRFSTTTHLRHALAALMLLNLSISDAAAVTIVDFGVAAWQAAFPQPVAINNKGDVAGVLSTAAGPEPFVWQNGVMTPLPTLQGATAISVTGINNAGQIVGYSNAADGLMHAVEWQNGTIAELPNEPGYLESKAYGINDSGQIVGSVDLGPANTTPHSVIWQNGAVSDVNTTGNTAAYGINSSGQVVGGQVPTIGFSAANGFQWQNGSLSPLVAGTYLTATAINNQGAIVGNQSPTMGSQTQHAFLLQNGVLTNLGTNGYPTSYATAINNLGQVIGVSDSNGYRPFLWQNGQMTSLNSLMPAGWTLWGVFGINDHEQIVGLGQPSLSSPQRDLVLVTLPEPGACTLGLVAGAFALVAYAARQRRETCERV